MSDISVERLYELCDIIDNAEKKSACQGEYSTILSAVKCSGANEKRLAAQLIGRYFFQFPEMREKSLDAIFELCEDDDVNIRKLVIKELPNLCRGGDGPHVAKLADILVQLLQTDDHQEQQIVHSSLFSVLKSHSKDTLSAIFGHILNVTEELIRDRAVKFLACKLKLLPEEVLTKQIEEYILEESKKVLQDVSGDEFILFMHILSNLKHLQTVAGRQLLLDIVVDQADLEKPFQPDEQDRVDQLIQCMKQSIPFLSKNVHSSKFLSYVLENVFPVLDQIPVPSNDALIVLDQEKEIIGSETLDDKTSTTKKQENGSSKATATTTTTTAATTVNNSTTTANNNVAENQRLEILRLTADLSNFVGSNMTSEEARTKIQTVFDRLMDVLPVPPSLGDAASSSAAETSLLNENSSDEPKIQFSEIECLIWILHGLCKKFPEFFATVNNKTGSTVTVVKTSSKNTATESNLAIERDEVKEFRRRLQYLARVIQLYSKKLNAALSGKKKEELKNEQNRLKLIALKTTMNISNAVKDFLHLPPTYSHTMSPSWRNASHEAKPETKKRDSDGENHSTSSNKLFKKNVEYYQPPSGKYSVKVDNFKNEFEDGEGQGGGFRSSYTWRRGGGRGAAGGGRSFRGGNFRNGRGRW